MESRMIVNDLPKFSKYSPQSFFFLGHASLSEKINKKSSEWIGK